MGIGSSVFNAQYAALTEARASLRVGRKQLDRCLCGSFATTRTATDEGVYEAVLASVKAVKAEWDAAFGAGQQKEGTAVQFCRSGETEWRNARIVGVSETDGIYSLALEAEFA
jgi:hypothetical protein